LTWQTAVRAAEQEAHLQSKPLRQRHGLAVSTEHYLRAILELREERGYARVVDIATRIGVTKGSVSIALAQLRDRGLVRFDQAHFPVLTAAGKRIAQDVRGRYHIVHSFLTDVLGLTPEKASAEACRWEHVISHDAADRLLDLLHFAVGSEDGALPLRPFRTFHRPKDSPWPGSATSPSNVIPMPIDEREGK